MSGRSACGVEEEEYLGKEMQERGTPLLRSLSSDFVCDVVVEKHGANKLKFLFFLFLALLWLRLNRTAESETRPASAARYISLVPFFPFSLFLSHTPFLRVWAADPGGTPPTSVDASLTPAPGDSGQTAAEKGTCLMLVKAFHFPAQLFVHNQQTRIPVSLLLEHKVRQLRPVP